MEPVMEQLHAVSWPDGRVAAVSLTFDVDGEAGLLGNEPDARQRLTARSERRYGIVRGLPRILDALDRHAVRATFFVPGATALQHPDAVREIVRRGHEIGHHGHEHLPASAIDAEAQRAELERGCEALLEVCGAVPAGYRSPSWEMTATTFELLLERGFAYDSSMMEDDRPYLLSGDERALVELPVHWSLDDWPHFANGADPDRVLELWVRELRCACAEGRHATYAMHPDIVGRGQRIGLLDGLLEACAAAGVWTATLADVAAAATAGATGEAR
jgi:peptidoglycan/xylan/chitin deacetylase (PgdA/CDA1 family)